jgi:hypothetical protein
MGLITMSDPERMRIVQFGLEPTRPESPPDPANLCRPRSDWS